MVQVLEEEYGILPILERALLRYVGGGESSCSYLRQGFKF
jgi:hypothetical protein